jgi:hypothetical protein
MPIIEVIPPKAVKDCRSPDGGYCVAKCDVCGTMFWPKRTTAKYCKRMCAVKAYKQRQMNKIQAENARVTREIQLRHTANVMADKAVKRLDESGFMKKLKR